MEINMMENKKCENNLSQSRDYDLSFRAYSSAFILMVFFFSAFNSSDPKIKVFSVGHGSCIMTIYKNFSILFDCGSMKYDSYLADKILRELFRKNISKLKFIVISHMHSDHLNGFFKLSKYLDIQSVYYSTSKSFSSKLKNSFLKHLTKPIFIQSDHEISIDKSFHVKFLTRHINDSSDENDSSLCSQLICNKNSEKNKTSILIPGDIEENGIFAFNKYYSANLKIDFLIWPHHGSTDISQYSFTTNAAKIIQCNSRDKGYKRKNALKITSLDFDFRLNKKSFAEDLFIYRNKLKKIQKKRLNHSGHREKIGEKKKRISLTKALRHKGKRKNRITRHTAILGRSIYSNKKNK